MKPSILVPIAFGLVIAMTPAHAASGKAKEEARRGCKRNFGGTSELLRIDKEAGYAYCRTGRLVEKFPFRRQNSKKDQPQEQAARTPAPAPKIQAPPQTRPPVPCQDCEEKPGQQSTSLPEKAVLPPVEETPPVITVPEVPAAPPVQPEAVTVTTAKPTREELISRYGVGLLEQAERICVKRNGPGATVDSIDEKSWQVVCSKPSQQ